jgi:hypothetical protein
MRCAQAVPVAEPGNGSVQQEPRTVPGLIAIVVASDGATRRAVVLLKMVLEAFVLVIVLLVTVAGAGIYLPAGAIQLCLGPVVVLGLLIRLGRPRLAAGQKQLTG